MYYSPVRNHSKCSDVWFHFGASTPRCFVILPLNMHQSQCSIRGLAVFFFLDKFSCSVLCFIFQAACCHSSLCLTLLRPSCQTWRTCLCHFCHMIPSIDGHKWACADDVTKCGRLIGRSQVRPTPAGLQNAEEMKLILLPLIMRQHFHSAVDLSDLKQAVLILCKLD